jgi:hypothetical protein
MIPSIGRGGKPLDIELCKARHTSRRFCSNRERPQRAGEHAGAVVRLGLCRGGRHGQLTRQFVNCSHEVHGTDRDMQFVPVAYFDLSGLNSNWFWNETLLCEFSGIVARRRCKKCLQRWQR